MYAPGRLFNDGFVEIYSSARKCLTHAADASLLAPAVLRCARQHGGRPVLKAGI
ncbi:hypothetical protein [Streptomyces sp. SAI-149]|uniref:hypothetical protein n=1 Tax=Streptomyces sp. SAI-149 TaxID=2940542 RepID=UPI002475405F|nr:hypothetical protein [Streptomyces sp. SAI-149]MDH6502441.1 hypothetical protein [Streptomyces sp. SAI-149]